MYKRIVTHYDFDGIASAAICSLALGLKHYFFTGPRTIIEAKVSITSNDVVCDLPYPLECGIWFDHHEGNLEDLRLRGLDVRQIPGRFDLKASCSRVVYNYFLEDRELPSHFESLVSEADKIDGFTYKNIDEWRKETPGKIIDGTLRIQQRTAKVSRQYMAHLVNLLRDCRIEKVAARPEVREYYEQYLIDEKRMLEQIKKDASFLSQDINQELVVLDQTQHNKRMHLLKHLAYLLYPNALAVIGIQNVYQSDIKTNNLCFSMSLSLKMSGTRHEKNVGEIMRTLNIGDGHPGAAAGVINCNKKSDMLKTKKEILDKIYDLWRNQ